MSEKTLVQVCQVELPTFFAEDREAFKSLCNTEMIELEDIDDQTDGAILWEMNFKSLYYTGSAKAGYVLENWEQMS